ncbi:DUF1156 domain-containing protein [Dictyobacter alpinus]|nr:DUF1156 domain-containing protein [Dictyobacter alpinus]
MGEQMTAVVIEGKRGRIYIAPDEIHIEASNAMNHYWLPSFSLPQNPRNFNTPIYGIDTFDKLFTPRQLMALTTFSDLVLDVKECISSNMGDSQGKNENDPLDRDQYINAIMTYLALAVDKGADYWSSICSWNTGRDTIRNTFARQAIPMVWDFAEVNPFSDSTGNFLRAIDWVAGVIELSSCAVPGEVVQRDATASVNGLVRPLISTDPPYYDNIGYADLSDFFYVWLRRSLSNIYPDLFGTMLVPKAQELVATPYRFGGSKQKAQQFFENGLYQAFERMRAVQHPDYPLTVYYAFKQTEDDSTENSNLINNEDNMQSLIASTGWETMLAGLIHSGFTITGTWPVRTERTGRTISISANALASSIVLVCRPRPIDAPSARRRQFINELRNELEDALKKMKHDGIAPVDLAQASIGPGMKVYSQYSQVLEPDGSPLSVRAALQLINRELDSILVDQEGEYDMETRWAVAWFEEYTMEAGTFGRAETLSKAKNASLQTLVEAGVLESRAGKVRLLKRDEVASIWNPESAVHRKVTTWAVMQRLIHALDKQGTPGAGAILADLPEYGEKARDLAYRLYNICERKGWSGAGLYYNMLVSSWPDIEVQARIIARSPRQDTLSFDD